jgi:hypothetical protein
MGRHSGWGGRGIAAVLLATLTGGCATSSAPIPALTLPSTSGREQTSATDPSPSSTASASNEVTVPAQAAAVPDGVYRVRLSRDEVIARGADDVSNAGTWTLSIAHGQYKLVCSPISDPDVDCGQSGTTPEPRQVETGHVRGTGQMVWFVDDLQSAYNGCVPGQVAGNGCGPMGPYGFTWRQTAAGLVFTDFVGLTDLAGRAANYLNYTIEPWARIA